MRVLAIDPGTLSCGYAVIDSDGSGMELLASGVISNKNTHAMPYRIKKTYDRLHEIIDANGPITHIAIETPFYSRNLQTFLKLGYIRGIVYLVSQEAVCGLIHFSPTEVKQWIAGKGNSTKEQVAMSVKLLFPEIGQHVKDDITDAIAVGVCAIWREAWK
jgi:crossover junction endodeoxyribonuclease RuvC